MAIDGVVTKTVYDDEVLKSFKVSCVFKDRFSITNGLDWDHNGEVMITSSADRIVYVYSLSKACISNVLQSKKYGAELVKFAHEGPRHILCCSDKDATTVRLWDIVENKYIKSFPQSARLQRGVGIKTHPSRNLMITNNCNEAVSIFSFDNGQAQATFDSSHFSLANFDCEGLIFAKYDGRPQGVKTLSLFDLNKLQTPFATFDLHPILKKLEDVVSIDFNPNGKYIVLGTNFKRLICVNSVNGSAVFACCYGEIPTTIWNKDDLCYPSISPDGKYLISGCHDGWIRAWNFRGQVVAAFQGHHGPPPFVLFNPKKAVFSSACLKVAWWQPDRTNSPS